MSHAKRSALPPRHAGAIIVALMFAIITLPLIGGCGEQMARVEDKQVKLQAMVAANSRQLATLSSQVHAGHKDVQKDLARLEQNDEQITGKVRTVQVEQGRLGQAVASAHHAIGKQVELLRENQELLKDGVAQVADVAQGTASDVTAIAREHAVLHQMVQSNGKAVAAGIDNLADAQQRIQTGVGQLHRADKALAEHIVAVSSKQEMLHQAVQDNATQADERLAVLTTGQGRTSSNLDGLQSLTQSVARNINDIATEQAAIYAAMNTHAGALRDTLTSVEQNQNNIQSAVDGVAATAHQASEGVGALAGDQANLRERLAANQRVVTGQLSAVARNQQDLQTGIKTVSEKVDGQTSQLAALATGQKNVHQTLATGNDAVTTRLSDLSHDQAKLHQNVSLLMDKTSALGADLVTTSTQQTALHQAVVAGDEKLTSQVAKFAQDQQSLQTTVDSLNEKADAAAIDLAAQHSGLSEDIKVVQGQAGTLSDHQQNLETRLSILSDKADALTAGVSAHKSLMNDNTALAHEVVAISKTQQTIGADLARLDGKADRLMSNVDGLAKGQGTLQQTLHAQAETTDKRMATVTQNQENLQVGLDSLMALGGQMTLDVMAVADEQTELKNTVRAADESLSEQVTTLASDQHVIQTSLDALSERAGQMAADLVDAKAGEAALLQSLQSHDRTMQERATVLSNNQAALREDAETDSGELARQIGGMSQNQKVIEQTLATHNEGTTARLAQLSDGQATLGNQLGVLTSTTGQTALDLVQLTDTQAAFEQMLVGGVESLAAQNRGIAADLTAVTDEQKTLADALKGHDETVAGRMSSAAADQLELRQGLDSVSTTADQLAEDLGSVGDTQQSIESAVKTSRNDLTAKLDAFAREQQLWQQRFDTTQAQIESLATNLSVVEQRVATLQGSLQTSLEGLVGVVAANAEARLQFETTFGQGVEDMAETVTQLQQAQGSLQEQLDLIERGTQNQTQDIIAAIERLTRQSTELKVSNAQTPLESSMVETTE